MLIIMLWKSFLREAAVEDSLGDVVDDNSIVDLALAISVTFLGFAVIVLDLGSYLQTHFWEVRMVKSKYIPRFYYFY